MQQNHRNQLFNQLLNADVGQFEFSFAQLQMLCFRSGIPDMPGIRPICYKLLLGYLPWDKRIWEETLRRKRSLYYEYITEFLSPFLNGQDTAEDNSILEQIDKDVRRTLVKMAFFTTRIPYRSDSPLSPGGADSADYGQNIYETSRALFTSMIGEGGEEYSRKHDSEDYHWEAVERILFVYSKLNKAVGYVQGMNEILGPLYYVLANDLEGDGKLHAEADAFWLFFALISEIKDLFMTSMDRDKSSGIGAWLQSLSQCLERQDLELWQDFKVKQIDMSFFGFRWLSVLMAREFTLPDLIRVWDSLFADKLRFRFLIHIGCAMIVLVRNRILQSSYQDIIQLLQEYPNDIDITRILQKAYEVYDEELISLADDGESAFNNNYQQSPRNQQTKLGAQVTIGAGSLQQRFMASTNTDALTSYLYSLVRNK